MTDFKLKRGINFQPYREWKRGTDVAQERFLSEVKKAGFDHIRCPFYMGPLCDESIKSFETIKDILNLVLESDLIPILDVHGFADLNQNVAEMRGPFVEMWRELARYLKDIDERVVFEIFNEPSCRLDDTELLNELQLETITAIRESNPTRWIAAATSHMNVIENLEYLKLPEDDKNIFATIHCYYPMEFTHQGCWWDEQFRNIKDKSWGSEEEKRELKDYLEIAKNWAEKNGRHLLMGEFGVYETARMEDRAAWTRYIIEIMEEYGIAWSYWEFAYGFAVYNIHENEWILPLKKALLGE